MLFEKLKEIKFQGKPVSINPLKNSTIPNKSENIRNALITFFEKKIENKKVINP